MTKTPVTVGIATLFALLLLGCQQESTTPPPNAVEQTASDAPATLNASTHPSTHPTSAVAVKKAPKPHTAQTLKQMLPQTTRPSASVASTAVASTAGESAIANITAGDATRGKRIARKCQSCHNFNSRRKVGPGLAGIYNRPAGQMADTNYSPELAKKAWRWDDVHLAAWICDSRAAVRTFSGNPSANSKMPAQRICEPRKQADLIAYLKTL